MARQWARDMRAGLAIDEVFLLARCEVRANRHGTDYLDLVLSDATGDVRARKWETCAQEFESLLPGSYVRLRGAVEEFQGFLQLRIDSVLPVDPASIDPTPFVRTCPGDVGRMLEDLRARASNVADPHLRQLLSSLLADEDFCRSFRAAPAASRNHHSYAGGLVEHVHSLVGLADFVAGHYRGIDRDLLFAGVVLHDLGKVRELESGPMFGYTKEGELAGHVAIGFRMLEERLAAIPGFPEDLRLRLGHMVLSHHGELEWGAPVVPKTLEALVLHLIDHLDAKVHMFQKAIAAPGNGTFTPWERAFGGRLYRGSSR